MLCPLCSVTATCLPTDLSPRYIGILLVFGTRFRNWHKWCQDNAAENNEKECMICTMNDTTSDCMNGLCNRRRAEHFVRWPGRSRVRNKSIMRKDSEGSEFHGCRCPGCGLGDRTNGLRHNRNVGSQRNKMNQNKTTCCPSRGVEP
jgi:hypothetical protein